MPITSSELVFLGAANNPEDESSLIGGAIDTAIKIAFTDIGATDSVEAVSSSAADIMNITVHGRNAAGERVSETKALTGTTAITFTTMGAIERFLKAVLASAAAGTITIRRATGDTTIATLEPGITQARRFFIDAFSDPSATKTYHEKFFIKNTDPALTLTTAVVSESADPSGLMTFAVEDAVNDNGTATNRLTAPTGITGDGFSGTAKAVPGNALASGAAIGVWARLSLASGNAPVESTWTPQITGATT